MKLLETFVYISAKDEALKTGLKSASKYARKEVSDMQKMFDSLSFKSLNVKNLLVGAAGLWGAKQAIDNLVGSTVKLGSAYNDMAARTGVSVENLSALGHAAQLTGADTDSLEKSLRQLTNNMLDTARGTGAARQTFRELNIGVQDARGNLRPTVDVMMQFADAIKGMTDETKQAAYASELFGARTGTKLLPMLKQGSAGLREMMEEAKRLGITMSTEEAAAADELGDTMDRLTGAMEGVKRAIAIGVIPAITGVVKQFTEWIVANREIIKSRVSEWIQKIADGMKLLWDHRNTIKTAFEVATIVLITSKLIALWEILSKIGAALVTIGTSKAFGIMAGGGLAAGAATTGIGLGAAATVYGGKKYADAVTPKGYLPGLPYASVMPTKMPTVPLNDPYGIVRAADGFKILKTQATSFYDTVRTVPGIGGPSKSGAGGGAASLYDFADFYNANNRPGSVVSAPSNEIIDAITNEGKPDRSFLGPEEPDIIKALRDIYERPDWMRTPALSDLAGQFVGPEMPEMMRNALNTEKEYTEKRLSLQREVRDSEVALMTDKYAQARIMETNRFNDEIVGYAGNSELMELAAQKHWNNMQAIANDSTKDMIQNAANFGVFWGDMMISIYQQSDHTFSSIASSFGKMIQQMAIKAMVSGFFGMLFGGPAGGAAAFKASLGFSGKAAGGPVSAGTPYMVGERGPEVFVPRQSGTIIPNGASKSVAYTDNSSITIQFPGNVSGATASELAVQLDRIIRERKSGEIEKLRRGVA